MHANSNRLRQGNDKSDSQSISTGRLSSKVWETQTVEAREIRYVIALLRLKLHKSALGLYSREDLWTFRALKLDHHLFAHLRDGDF